MKFMLGNKSSLRCVGALLPVVLAAHAGPASAIPAGASDELVKSVRVREYSVINLSPMEAESAVLNRRGQVAFASNSDQVDGTGFFDGQGLHRVGPFEHPIGYKRIWGLNNRGRVIVEADSDAGFPDAYRAYTWSLPGVVNSLTNGVPAGASAINERNQIVGFIAAPGGGLRAHRWNADGTGTDLGPAPASLYSEAFAINDNGLSAGYSDNRAMAWDANGKAIDLGLPSGSSTVARFVNAQDQVAGAFQVEGSMGVFVWHRSRGRARIGPFPGLVRIMGFNDHGQVAADRQVGREGLTVTFAPFTWTAKRGTRLLPLGGAAHGRVDAMNNRAEMVGFVQRAAFDDTSKRATYWDDVSSPVDLNTRLHRAPHGLVLKAALAINDNGTILANSNAGLVLLRPGRTGTAAPVLSPMTGADYADFNGTLDFTVNFVDSDPRETHVASAHVNDFCPESAPSLREVRGAGDVSLRHTFCRGGFFKVTITITDRAGNATQSMRQVYVPDGAVTTLMGHGTLAAPAGNVERAVQASPRIVLWAPLGKRSAPANAIRAPEPVVNVTGPFHFRADSVDEPVANRESVQLSGTGRLNGRSGYRFSVDAKPGSGQPGGADRLWLRISHIDAADGATVVDYDNGAGPARTAARTTSKTTADGMLLGGGTLQLIQPQTIR